MNILWCSVERNIEVSVLAYYRAAIPRAFSAGWHWAVGQGLYLTILLATGLLIFAIIYSVIQALRRVHSWADAVSNIHHAIADFFGAAIIATLITLLILFMVFLVMDAPLQINLANKKITDLNQRLNSVENDKEITIEKLKGEKDSEIAILQARVKELESPNIAYSVSALELEASLDLNNVENTFELRPKVTNQVNRVLHLQIRRLTVEYASKTIMFDDPRDYIIRPGATITFYPNKGLSRDEFDQLPYETLAKLTCSTAYGEAGKPYSRLNTKVFIVTVSKMLWRKRQQPQRVG
jgi:hypothetical protein